MMAQDGASTADAPRFRAIALELRDLLGGAKRAVDEEIGAYPTPIPRCDAQFNHLYERRTRIALTLDRVNDALRPGVTLEELMAVIAEFGAEAPVVGSAREERLRERMRSVLTPGRYPRANATRDDTTP